MKRSVVGLCAVVALAGSTANAQTLQYRLNGGTPQNIVANTINVGTVNGDVNLHIFDSGTFSSTQLPTLSVDSTITIAGAYVSGSLLVGFTAGDETPDVNQPPATPTSSGVVNLGTLGQPVLSFSSGSRGTTLDGFAARVVSGDC